MKILAIVVSSLLLFGCESLVKKDATQVAEIDLGMQMLKQFEDEGIKSNDLIQQEENNQLVKWIQPENKKEACKIFFRYKLGEDSSLDSTYKRYWDGKCKDGYAFGLGREFEIGSNNREALGEYSGGQVKPKYYMAVEKKDGRIEQIIGNLSTKQDSKIKRLSLEKDSDKLKNEFSNVSGGYFFIDRVFKDRVFKDVHELIKLTNGMSVDFATYDENPKHLKHGFTIYNFKDKKKHVSLFQPNKSRHLLLINDTYEKDVEVSPNYLSAMQRIQDEIQQKIKEVDVAVSYAEQKKQEYKNSICKDDVKVNFISESEYKEICTKYEHFNAPLAAKEKKLEEQRIAEKLANEHQNKIEQLANNETQLDANIYWHISQINEKKLKLTKFSEGSASYTELKNELAYLSKELAPLEEAKALIKKRQEDASNRKLASERSYQDQVLRQQREAQQLQRDQFEQQQGQQQMNQIYEGLRQFNQDSQKFNTPRYTNCYGTYGGATCYSY